MDMIILRAWLIYRYFLDILFATLNRSNTLYFIDLPNKINNIIFKMF